MAAQLVFSGVRDFRFDLATSVSPALARKPDGRGLHRFGRTLVLNDLWEHTDANLKTRTHGKHSALSGTNRVRRPRCERVACRLPGFSALRSGRASVSGFRVQAQLSLLAFAAPRREGWRGLCEIVGLLSQDGETLFGCEAERIDGGKLVPGEVRSVVLRFWAPVPADVSLPRDVRLFEGRTLIAAGCACNMEPT